jgi:trehalose 6-phosphate phosphatase
VTIALAVRPTAIWIVSGRTVSDLAAMIRLDRFADLWGSHGAERRMRDGCWVGPAPSRAAGELLDRAARALRDLGAGALVERKLYGLALHGRGADPRLYLAARRAFVRDYAKRAEEAGLRFAAFDGGIELRPEEFDKGRTVERAFAELGDDAAIAYLGDDATDEDAFAALGDRGLPVLVAPRPRPTLARAWLVPPAEVLEFLGDWGAACSRGAPA